MRTILSAQLTHEFSQCNLQNRATAKLIVCRYIAVHEYKSIAKQTEKLEKN